MPSNDIALELTVWHCSRCNEELTDPEHWLGPIECLCLICATLAGIPSIDKE